MRYRLAALIAVALVAGAPPAEAAETLRSRLQQLPERFQAERSQLQKLQKRTDADGALALGRLLKNGLAAGRDNPLRQSDEQAAEAAFARAIAGGGAAAVEAEVELADLLAVPGRPADDMRRAVELYRAAAAGGSSSAAVTLAHLLEDGQVPRDIASAKVLYEQALRDEQPDAAFGLARVAAAAGNAAAAKSFTAEGIVFLRLKAEHSASAASALATRYATGDGVPRDIDRARAMLVKAIALGQTSAAVALGMQLGADQGKARDPETARTLLLDAEAGGSIAAARSLLADAAGPDVFHLGADEAELLARHVEGIGDVDGMLAAASLYRTGRLVKQDKARADAIIGRVLVAARNDPPALLRLGRMFRRGTDLPADPDRAMTFFMAAAEAGIADGAIAAAELALDATTKLAKVDPRRVIALLQGPAVAKDPRALLLLGDAYRRGYGVAKSAADAARYFDAALAGSADPLAMERRALLYLDNVTSRGDGLRAIALLQKAANLGRPQAMDVLGRQYEYGTYVPKDTALAERWFSRAGDLGLMLGLIDLGELYETASPPVGSLPKAIATYQRAWAAGSGDAGLHLGRIFKAGGKRPEAKAMFQAAITRGSGLAAVELAALALDQGPSGQAEATRLVDDAIRLTHDDSNAGLAVVQAIIALPDASLIQRGVKLLGELDAAGDGSATRILAGLYVAGKVGPFDRATAEAWARKSAQRGAMQPLFELAAALIRGDHGGKDVAGGVALLEEGHRLVPTHMQTVILLARQYQTGAEGVKQNVGRALQLLESAAQFGSTTAQVMTARAYAEGNGARPDPAKAILWFTRAADQGSLEAMMEAGRYYAAGEGVKLDAERAFGFFYRAAGKGSVEAMVEVSKSLLVGYGTAQDVPNGVSWLERAAAAGSVSAMYDLFQFYNLDDPDHHDPEKALHWINEAASHGSAEAAFRLALLYRDGRMVKQSEDEMKAWLQRAAKAGHNYSARLLVKLAKAGSVPVAHDDDPNDSGEEE